MHDIVLEYVQGQLDPTLAATAHRALIQQFIAARPHGGWNRANAAHDQTARYISQEVEHHMKYSWQQPILEDTLAMGWITDHIQGSFDVISTAAARYVGSDIIDKLAERAEKAGDFWLASLLYYQAGFLIHEQNCNAVESAERFKLTFALLAKVETDGSAAELAKEIVEIKVRKINGPATKTMYASSSTMDSPQLIIRYIYVC